jgi:sulfhydrogenase subunit gamma (sulfur reductase)
VNPNPYLPLLGRLVEVRDIATEIKLFRVEMVDDSESGGLTHQPGQFAFISALGIGEAPFGFANSAGRGPLVDFAISRLGNVTTGLHELGTGEMVGIRGPLGNSFPMEKFKGKNLVIIGGGIGGAPLRPVIQYVIDHRNEYGQLTIFWAARNPSLLIFTDEYDEWRSAPATSLYLTVDQPDDSWNSDVGLITQLVEKVHPSADNAVAITCGPPIMIKYVTKLISEMGFSDENSYVTLESRMHCGIGKCGRCNLGGKLVCKDGPVFNMAEVGGLMEPYNL